MTNTDKNFNLALNLCEKKLSHKDCLIFLKNGNVIEKQYAALNLNKITSNEDTVCLLSNLVGVDGKIREAVAYKMNELISNKIYTKYFNDTRNYTKFSNGTIDIDSNVCRLVIDSARYLWEDTTFSTFYAQDMYNFIKIALNEFSKLSFKDKKYKANKQFFKIYWCLVALCDFYTFLEEKELKEILFNCSNLSEYTIREKCLQILNKTKSDNELQKLIEKLSNDENYYVRNAKL